MTTRPTLLLRALGALAAALVVFTALTAWFTFRSARETAYESQDERLGAVALALARSDVANALPRALTMDPEAFAERMKDNTLPETYRPRRMMHRHRMTMHESAGEPAEPQERRTVIPAGEPVLVRILTKGGQAVAATFEIDVTEGCVDVMLAGTPHRLCLFFLPSGRYTAVAEPTAALEDEAEAAALTAVQPLLILFPVLGLVLAAALWSALRPLSRAAAEVRQRSANALEPLSAEDLPAEIEPFVASVNDLLGRVRDARTREIRFTADAAHELRSPLTSLTIETEHLLGLELPPDARRVVENLEGGLERAVHQVSQLLLLARAQAAGESPEALRRDEAPWYFSELAGELVETLLPAMEEKSIRFDAEGLDDDRPIEGVSRASLSAIVRNLLENAVRYTPEAGAVSLKAERSNEALTLVVSDTGPGIPETERARVFDPFYRIVGSGAPGTGLGLAIVKTYAERLGATVTLDDAEPHGLKATVRVPLVRGK